MTEPVEHRAQVAVVGAGPVGVTIANYLGRYGVRTVLIDRSEQIVDYPRAVGMDDECLRSFQGIGLADEMLADMIQNVPLKMFAADGRCLADIRPDSKEYGWPRRNIFMQQIAERTLRAGLGRYPHVRNLLGHELVRLEQDGTEVRLHLDGAQGQRALVHAEYVVGADGGRSTVREQLGIPLSGDTHPRKWVVIECDNDPLDAPYTGLHGDPKRPYVCLDLPYNYRRWEFMLFPGEDADAMLRPEKVCELLTGHVPDPTALNIIRARVYTHHSRVADRFVDGRICLAGDAAHLMPPWAGQGLNTGVRDATNVAWKMAAVVTGRAHPRILATYDTERREHARAMVNLSDTIGRLLSRRVPRWRGRATVWCAASRWRRRSATGWCTCGSSPSPGTPRESSCTAGGRRAGPHRWAGCSSSRGSRPRPTGGWCRSTRRSATGSPSSVTAMIRSSIWIPAAAPSGTASARATSPSSNPAPVGPVPNGARRRPAR